MLSSHKLREKGEKIRPLGGMIKIGFKAESIFERGLWTCDGPAWRWGSSVSSSFFLPGSGPWWLEEGNVMPKMAGRNPHFSVLINGMSSVWV